MRALHWRAPDAQQLRGSGLQLKHFRRPDVEVWPECWQSISLYRQNASQLIYSPGGPAGFYYPVYHAELDRQGLTGLAREEAMQQIRVIESAAIECLHEEMQRRTANSGR